MKQLLRSVGPFNTQIFGEYGWQDLNCLFYEFCGDAIQCLSEFAGFYDTDTRVVDKHGREVIRYTPDGKIWHPTKK